MREVLHAKIHNATVTESNLAYIGSITIDGALIDAVGLWVGQRVMVVSNTSGARLETYVIRGEDNSGVICMNGACSHLIKKGEQIIIMGFETSDKPVAPKIVLVGEGNRITKYL
jgi:aspartate 1-decarboxylase